MPTTEELYAAWQACTVGQDLMYLCLYLELDRKLTTKVCLELVEPLVVHGPNKMATATAKDILRSARGWVEGWVDHVALTKLCIRAMGLARQSEVIATKSFYMTFGALHGPDSVCLFSAAEVYANQYPPEGRADALSAAQRTFADAIRSQISWKTILSALETRMHLPQPPKGQTPA
jgi:hypothetical protein